MSLPMHPPLPLYLGLSQWSHNHWLQSLYGKGCKNSDRLSRYAEVFHTVEGNTTFYAIPSMTTVKNWNDATSESFRFTFKIPQTITHQQQLRHSNQSLVDFLNTMSPVEEKTGCWMIQLPARFAPNDLPLLDAFLDQFPKHVTTGVEVRHPAFFAKGDEEKALNRMLLEKGSNRIIMDSRPVFSATPNTDAIIDAQKKKPRVPVHAIATADNPVIRFIGHPDDACNDPFFVNWLQRLPLWIAEGKTPYLFIHTPDNNAAPESARRLYGVLREHIAKAQPSLSPLPELAMPTNTEMVTPQISLL
ncbi:DUF72 domain-containing protein [Photobacterium leiognathi]|uniref:DUF72 domain-containing protein n=1 Tax=Photobacterium leiognathi TaxID=553611 RepID=UPI002980D0CE|nr:DUF72 domain-containing protein [Photobacterium leiognathi]